MGAGGLFISSDCGTGIVRVRTLGAIRGRAQRNNVKLGKRRALACGI